MKCTKDNVKLLCRTIKNNLEDKNGQGEFDAESDLLSVCEQVIGWLEELENRVV